jgi:hypothetical protein
VVLACKHLKRVSRHSWQAGRFAAGKPVDSWIFFSALIFCLAVGKAAVYAGAAPEDLFDFHAGEMCA